MSFFNFVLKKYLLEMDQINQVQGAIVNKVKEIAQTLQKQPTYAQKVNDLLSKFQRNELTPDQLNAGVQDVIRISGMPALGQAFQQQSKQTTQPQQPQTSQPQKNQPYQLGQAFQQNQSQPANNFGLKPIKKV